MSEQRDRYLHLVGEVDQHDRRYYLEMAPTISDAAYDQLYRELKELEAAHPDWVVPESPTQRVAPTPLSEFPKVVRQQPDAIPRQHLQPGRAAGVL